MPTEPAIRRFTSQGLSLAYAQWGAEWGEASKPLVLLIHGGRDHKRSWDWTAEALMNDWRVVAHDLRGHGESDWVSDCDYAMTDHVLDLAAFIDHLEAEEVRIVAHSLGGMIALRYAGLYPERVTKIVAVEGLGMSPRMLSAHAAKPIDERLRGWIDAKRGAAGRILKRHPSLAAAEARMREANPHLSEEQIRHLTLHGVRRHEDGTVSFRYDPGVMTFPAIDLTQEELRVLWGRIACPALLLYGRDGTASNPLEDGRASAFRNAEVRYLEKAGHWLHHDQFAAFIAMTGEFLR